MLRQTKECLVELSARNQITGTITAVELGAVMADVSVDIGNGQRLQVGDEIVLIIKATDVMVGKPSQ
jgi:molybdate transport system regulatory protein